MNKSISVEAAIMLIHIRNFFHLCIAQLITSIKHLEDKMKQDVNCSSNLSVES